MVSAGMLPNPSSAPLVSASIAQRITQAVKRYDTPRERLLAVFEGQAELFAQPG
jgi:hypothetical protein